MRKLTIGIPTYDDYDGLYFTIQSIRMYHKEVINDIEFLIVDNNPSGIVAKENENFSKAIKEPFKYLKLEDKNGTAHAKNEIFKNSKTPYTICIDSHVLLEPGCLSKLIAFYDEQKDDGNLLQGPLVYDDFTTISTHFDLVWRGDMWGIWGTDSKGVDANSQPFEIPAQGMGVFTCRTESWLKFNSLFKGFGGEEGYIHEKFRKNGKKVLCLPFLRWMHRFGRPNGIPYKLTLDDKIRNYYIGFLDLGLDVIDITNHFKSRGISVEHLNKIYMNSLKEIATNKENI